MTFSALDADLATIDRQGLRRRRRVLAGPQRARPVVDGRGVLAFCSNDYLGLADDPRLAQAARDGVAQYGVGSGASHLILGHTQSHHALEEALAKFVQMPRALLFSTGYMANIGVLTALVGRTDAVFADRLNHASLNDAALLSRAQFRRYPHGDMNALERLLAVSTTRRKVVVSDAVFSMDGDLAPVAAILRLCEQHDAWLLLDDAHGFGVLGARGRGILEHTNLRSPRIIYMATLGKAAGVFGAFVAGEPEVIEMLVQRARPYIYTTATPPMLAHALLSSMEIIGAEGWRRERIAQLVKTLRQGATGLRWPLLASDTAIQPLMMGDSNEALRVSAALEARGVLVPAIRPPTVPRGTARLRISLSAAHTVQDVATLTEALHAVGNRS